MSLQVDSRGSEITTENLLGREPPSFKCLSGEGLYGGLERTKCGVTRTQRWTIRDEDGVCRRTSLSLFKSESRPTNEVNYDWWTELAKEGETSSPIDS